MASAWRKLTSWPGSLALTTWTPCGCCGGSSIRRAAAIRTRCFPDPNVAWTSRRANRSSRDAWSMILRPSNKDELVQALRALAQQSDRVARIERVDLSALARLVEHTPQDLTVTVEAGL